MKKMIMLLLSLLLLFLSASAEKGDVPTMKTLKDVEEMLASFGLSEYNEEISELAKGSMHIALMPESDEGIPIGTSKMGGLPDLPKDVDWFREEFFNVPLSFICQINFAETKPYDKENKLPDHGMLYFFYDCSEDGHPWGYDPTDRDGWKVFYYEGDLSALTRSEAPEDLEGNGCVFASAALRFDSALALPDWDSTAAEGLTSILKTNEDQENYCELVGRSGESVCNKLLGHSNNIQGGMEEECEFVTNGLYTGDSSGGREGRALSLDRNAGHWNLLLQVDSNKDCNMMWGDAGRLYIWITDEDLEEKNFDASWLIVQCY